MEQNDKNYVLYFAEMSDVFANKIKVMLVFSIVKHADYRH